MAPKDSSQTPTEAHEEVETPDIHNVPEKIQRAKEVYKEFAGIEDAPATLETLGWYLYSLCSYSIHTVLIPIVFPLIISQLALTAPSPPEHGWSHSLRGLPCNPDEMKLYKKLTHSSILVNDVKFSPLHWTAISWAAGIFVSGPFLAFFASHLDHGRTQQLIFSIATVIGALFCLPVGFIKSSWPFLPYAVVIVVTSTIASAVHSRQLGLMVRGFTGPNIKKQQFPTRRAIASWLSLYATAAGSAGASIIAAFTYNMLGRSDKQLGLWIVSIFSGLKWLVGICDAVVSNRPGRMVTEERNNGSAWAHAFTIFKYPHAAGSLAGIFFSSLTTSCIFTGGVLYVVGGLCLTPVFVLYTWLIYFTFPLISLPLLHPLQLLIRADAVQMQLFGFLLAALVSGVGFYFRHRNWHRESILIGAILQSTATGALHAFGPVLLMDCSPPGKEGAFSVWFAWVKAIGTCAGFAVASAWPGKVETSFGVAFCTILAGIVTLIFGNISNFGGAVAAGHVTEIRSEKPSPVHGMENSCEWRRGTVHMEVGEGEKVQLHDTWSGSP